MNTNHSKAGQRESSFAKARERMVEHLCQKGIGDLGVLEAMATIPRHLFVEKPLRSQAYEDSPLPIEGGQTISQPYMVALMTELLALTKVHRVLEIGAGSGYQTAILAYLAQFVYALEIVPELVRKASWRLQRLGFNNVEVRQGDGTVGWPEGDLFDSVLVAAGSPRIPRPLLDQVKEGGRLVIPVGDEKMQRLTLVIKGADDNIIEDHGGCVFVKLLGKHGWDT